MKAGDARFISLFLPFPRGFGLKSSVAQQSVLIWSYRELCSSSASISDSLCEQEQVILYFRLCDCCLSVCSDKTGFFLTTCLHMLSYGEELISAEDKWHKSK